MFQQLGTRLLVLGHIMLRSRKIYGLPQGHPQWISGDIHWATCIFLATSWGSKGRWCRYSSSPAPGKYHLAEILDCRPITVWVVLRGQSWRRYLERVVFLDYNAGRFGARLFNFLRCTHISSSQFLDISNSR